MTSKTQRIIAMISTAVVTLMMTVGALVKFLKSQSVVEGFDKLGVGAYIQTLGAFEVLFLVLFLYPKTMRIGYLLFFAYLGGAMATHLSHGGLSLQPVVPMALMTLNVFLRDKSFFYATSGRFIN